MSESDIEEQINNNDITQTNKDKKKKKKNKSKNTKSENTNANTSKPISAMGKLIAERKRLQEEEEERIRKIEEEEEKKKKEEEEREAEIKRKEEEDKERKKKAKQDKIDAQKKAGLYKTKSEKEREKKNKLRLEQIKKMGIIKDDGRIEINQGLLNPNSNLNQNITKNKEMVEELEYRSPLFTIMGHVDTGKTTLLDYLRKTSVQSHEVGGITQQIGATILTKNIILKQIGSLESEDEFDIKVPGLLMVDTPGHEAFKNLRKLGSKLADIALVIVDLLHGLEPQTIESIKLLNESNTPYMFVLNKIDRLYGWKKDILDDKTKTNSKNIKEIIELQDLNVQEEFKAKYNNIKTQIMTQGINNELYWNNTSPTDTISVIPISAITGDGISDLLKVIINYSQTVMNQQILWNAKLDCIVMELSNIEGQGLTADCIIKNGCLEKGDIIKFKSKLNNDIIYSKIKTILITQENTDSKSTSKFISYDKVKEARGIKIVASDIDLIQIGSSLEKCSLLEYNSYIESNNKTNILDKKNIYCSDNNNNSGDLFDDILNINETIKLDSEGIGIFCSTQGSAESLVQFIRSSMETEIPIKISYVSIGNVMKKDLLKFALINSSNTIIENKCVLAFEVDIDKDAIEYAKDNDIQIFEDKTIYRLFNQYKEYANKQYVDRKEKARENTVFPCILKIIESNIFNKKNPLIMGVEVLEGTLHLGTPLITLPSKTYIGKVVGIQVNKQDVKVGKTSQSVCVKIDNQTNPNITYGRQFQGKDLLYSNVSRESVDILKEYFKKDMSKDDIGLLIKLKKLIGF